MNFGSYISEDCSKLVIYDLLPQTTLCDFRNGTSGCQTLKIRLKRDDCDDIVCPDICFSTSTDLEVCLGNVIDYGNIITDKDISLYEPNPVPGEDPFERILDSISLISGGYPSNFPIWNYLEFITPINLALTNIQEWNNSTNSFENVNMFNTAFIFSPNNTTNFHYLKLFRPRPAGTVTNPDLKFKYFLTKVFTTSNGTTISVDTVFEVDFLNNSLTNPSIYSTFTNLNSKPSLEELVTQYECNNTVPIIDLTLQSIETCTTYEIAHTYQPDDVIIPEETVFSEEIDVDTTVNSCELIDNSEYYIMPNIAEDVNKTYIIPLYSSFISPVEMEDFYEIVIIYPPTAYTYYNNNINVANAMTVIDSVGSSSSLEFNIKNSCTNNTDFRELDFIIQNSLWNTIIDAYNNNPLTNVFTNSFVFNNFQLVGRFSIKRQINTKSSFGITLMTSYNQVGVFRRDRITYYVEVPAYSAVSSNEFIQMISYEKDITLAINTEFIGNQIGTNCVMKSLTTDFDCNTAESSSVITVPPQKVTVPAKTIELEPIRYTSTECLTATPTILTCAVEITPKDFCLDSFDLEVLEVEIELNGVIETHCLVSDCSNIICDLLKCIENNPSSELASLYVLYTEMKQCKECKDLKSILEKIKQEVNNCGCNKVKMC